MNGRLTPRAAWVSFALALVIYSGVAHAQDGKAASNAIKDIKELLTDTAAGHVSAASMLGIGGDAVTAVENSRALVTAVKGLGTKGSQVALSFAPARSSFLPMSLPTYATEGHPGYRLLGNTTLSYAQGTAKIASVDMERRAFALETSVTLNRDDDPLIAVHKTCTWAAPLTQPGVAADFTAANKAYGDCVANKEAELAKKWNISRFSISWGTGSVRPDGASSTRLGQTIAASLIYGFDHFGSQVLKEGGAVSLTVRRARDEPVLAELAKGKLVRKDSTLAAMRVSGGTPKVRGLFEVSNARSSDITATQGVYKHAFGLDLNVGEGAWLNVRTGKQRKTGGSGDETATLLNFSLSPKAGLL